MTTLPVQVLRYVDHYFPGIVECELADAMGGTHRFVEKVPTVTSEPLNELSAYPTKGEIACEILESWKENGISMIRVTTERPWGIESTAGRSIFVVLESQLRL